MIPRHPGCYPSTSRKPRASGDDPAAPAADTGADEVNPARAGMIPLHPVHKPNSRCKPRASGDDPRGRTVILDRGP